MNKKIKEKIVINILKFSAISTIIITIFILLSLIFGSIPFFKQYSIIKFLTGTSWAPNAEIFGVIPLLIGTMKIVFFSSIIAIPLGLLIAIYLSEYASKRVRLIIKPLIEILAGIPSIIYGFFAYAMINPLVSSTPYSTLGASIALGIMLIPMIASLSEDVLYSIPNSLREASLGLGSTKSETIVNILIPAGLSGIIGSFVLAISRAFGETMIVTLAAGSVASMSLSPLSSSMTMTGAIVQTAGTDASILSPEYTVLYAIGILLFLITLFLNLGAKKIITKFKINYN